MNIINLSGVMEYIGVSGIYLQQISGKFTVYKSYMNWFNCRIYVYIYIYIYIYGIYSATNFVFTCAMCYSHSNCSSIN